MSEATWYKWLVISTVLHFMAIAALSISFGKATRKIDLSNAYSVSLVGDMGGGSKGSAALPRRVEAPARETPKSAKPVKPEPVKVKPTKPKPERIDKKEVSINKKKLPPKETQRAEKAPSKDELDALNKRLKEIKKRTYQVDIGGAGKTGAGAGPGLAGSPFAGEGTGRPMDLVGQRYVMSMTEKIMSIWGIPGAGNKNLLTIVTIKIRKDGRIVDMDIDQRSGNRIYDESVMRALRSIDLLPPLPPSMGDSFEFQLYFRPEGMS